MTASASDLPIIPFRWDLSRRKELDRYASDLPSLPITLKEVRRHCARIIAFAGDADLCFVGRSPESFFDYLSGVFFETSWQDRLHLLQFSMYYDTEGRIRKEYPGAIAAIRDYFRHVGIAPSQLRDRNRAVAFVDIVETAGTMRNLFTLLYNWSKELDVAWKAVCPKIRVVGLTVQKKTSPKTWRWQQQVSWVKQLQIRQRQIKNVSLPVDLYRFMGGFQKKVTSSYRPWRWGKPEAELPPRESSNLEALRCALAYFDQGLTKKERRAFASELTSQREIRLEWFRQLIHELNGVAKCM